MSMHEKLQIRSPETPEEFEQYYHIRWKTLREPWGEPVGSERDSWKQAISFLVGAKDSSRSE